MEALSPTYIVALLFALGLFFSCLTIGRIGRRRPLAAARSGLTACLCLALALLATAAGMNLWTYHRLSIERPLASLEFTAVAPQRYEARIRDADGSERIYAVNGDQWQLEARVLKWHGLANLLGLDAQFRLERLTGRYADIESEGSAPRTAHDLSSEPGLDFWRITRRYPRWLPIVDAVYGNATYAPMADRARFEVSMTQSGLIARPDNEIARQALEAW